MCVTVAFRPNIVPVLGFVGISAHVREVCEVCCCPGNASLARRVRPHVKTHTTVQGWVVPCIWRTGSPRVELREVGGAVHQRAGRDAWAAAGRGAGAGAGRCGREGGPRAGRCCLIPTNGEDPGILDFRR